jgi:hypothetical protein
LQYYSVKENEWIQGFRFVTGGKEEQKIKDNF